MSWQSALACWFLRRSFRPRTVHPGVDVARARELTSSRVWSPKVPPGWRLIERYGPGDAPMRGEWLLPNTSNMSDDSPTTVLYLHGGGYYFCSPHTHRSLVFALARRSNARIFSLDYRLAPEHPFPAALGDALAAYRWLVADGVSPRTLVIAGDSAGGGLALATLHCATRAIRCRPAGCCSRRGRTSRHRGRRSRATMAAIRCSSARRSGARRSCISPMPIRAIRGRRRSMAGSTACRRFSSRWATLKCFSTTRRASQTGRARPESRSTSRFGRRCRTCSRCLRRSFPRRTVRSTMRRVSSARSPRPTTSARKKHRSCEVTGHRSNETSSVRNARATASSPYLRSSRRTVKCPCAIC
jgi:alpha/beta hydrolase fold